MIAINDGATCDNKRARVSDIKRGKTSQFSLDMLIRLASRAGLKPKVKLAA